MSSQQIIFFEKNKADYSDATVALTASQGSTYAPFVQRRSNNLGWMTTGSVDSDNTTLTCDFVNTKKIDNIILIGHNFKAYTIKYWDGSTYQDFSTPINSTAVVATTSRHTFTAQATTKIQVTITGTQVVNADKKLNQLIATKLIGQLAGWPQISKPTINLNKRLNTMLSGKLNIGTNVGGFYCDLKVSNWSSAADLTIVETLYSSGNGFLVWLCGGDENQFSSVRIPYRLKDLFLMKCQNNHGPEWVQGLYKTGQNITLSLAEVTV